MPSRKSLCRILAPLALLTGAAVAPLRGLECRLLPAPEAARVIGEGVRLLSALEGGACQYERGTLTLDVVQPVSMDDGRVLLQAFESMMSSGRGDAIQGIGDRAFVAKKNSGYQLMFLRGKTLAGVSVYGEGSDAAAMREKLIEAAKKIASRL